MAGHMWALGCVTLFLFTGQNPFKSALPSANVFDSLDILKEWVSTDASVHPTLILAPLFAFFCATNFQHKSCGSTSFVMVLASCEGLLFYSIIFENLLQNCVNTLAANLAVPVVEERRHASDVASILQLCVFHYK